MIEIVTPSREQFSQRLENTNITRPNEQEMEELESTPLFHELGHALALRAYALRNKARITRVWFGPDSGGTEGFVDANEEEDITLAMLCTPFLSKKLIGHARDVKEALEKVQSSNPRATLERGTALSTAAIQEQGTMAVVYTLAHTIKRAQEGLPEGERSLSGKTFEALVLKVQNKLNGLTDDSNLRTISETNITKILREESLLFFFRKPKGAQKTEFTILYGADQTLPCCNGENGRHTLLCDGKYFIQPFQTKEAPDQVELPKAA